MHRIDLTRKADEVLTDLDGQAREHVLALINSVAEEPAEWPPCGTWELAEEFTDRAWVTYIAHADGIEVFDVGWLGP